MKGKKQTVRSVVCLHCTGQTATVDFWQPHQQLAPAAVFYFTKSRQDPDLGGLDSGGAPE